MKKYRQLMSFATIALAVGTASAEPVKLGAMRISSKEDLLQVENTIAKWIGTEGFSPQWLSQGLTINGKWFRALEPLREKSPVIVVGYIDSEVNEKYADSLWLNVQDAVVCCATRSREDYLREFTGAVETNGMVRLDNPNGRVGNDEYHYFAFSADGKWTAVATNPEMASAALDEVRGFDGVENAPVSIEIGSAGLKIIGVRNERLGKCMECFSDMKLVFREESDGLVFEGRGEILAGRESESVGCISPEDGALAFAPKGAVFVQSLVSDEASFLEHVDSLKEAGMDFSQVKVLKGPSGAWQIAVGASLAEWYVENFVGWLGMEKDDDLTLTLSDQAFGGGEAGNVTNCSYSITLDGCDASARPAERVAALLPGDAVEGLLKVTYIDLYALFKTLLRERISQEGDSLRDILMPMWEQLPKTGGGIAVKSWRRKNGMEWRAKVAAEEIKGLFLMSSVASELSRQRQEAAARDSRSRKKQKKSPVEKADRLVGCGDLTGALAALERAPTNDWAMCYAVGDFYGTHVALPTNRAERLHCWMDRAYQMADDERKQLVASRCASGLWFDRYGYPKDRHYASLWLHRAADGGSAYWQCVLADTYARGLEGFQVNGEKALYYLEKAEQQKHLKTHHVRASMYELGVGLPQDYKKALECLEMGMKRGSDLCPIDYAIMLVRGIGGDSRRAEGFAMLQKLVTQPQGVESPGLCLYWLGYACERGEGVERDMDRAIEYYKRAAELNRPYAIERLKELNVKWPEE